MPRPDTRPSRLRPAPPDWLPPLQSQNSTPGRVLRRVDIHAQQHCDWFLAFAAAMEPIDNVQSKQLAKAYLFLRMFVPRGLTGRFGHIRGKDVMDHVLCHNELAFSRHRLARQVIAAFRKLEEWMSDCEIWTVALQKARGEVGDRAGRRNSNRTALGLRNLNRKAIGLFSPAAIMAVLIIAYPDPGNHFHDLIGRLQIDWMVIQDHSKLSIQHGFWKGMTSKDLGTVFTQNNADEERTATFEMLVDYDRILGPDFLACRKDIRPFLPEQFKAKVNLSDELSRIEDDFGAGKEVEGDRHSGGVHAGSKVIEDTGRAGIVDASRDLRSRTPIGRDDIDSLGDPRPLVQAIISLREHLDTNDSKVPPRAAERWLVAQLLEEQKPFLRAWCQHWERKIEEVSNARDQHIVRSLFLQSLCRLKNFSAASDKQATAFMLLCIAESEAQPSGEEQADMSSLEISPSFATFVDAREEFRRLANNTGAPTALLEEILAHQLVVLHNFTRESPFSDYLSDLLQVETLYMRLLVLEYEDPTIDPETVAFWRHQRDNILHKTNRELLKLDSWQTRGLLLPGGLDVLTDYQNKLFRETYSQDHDTSTLDLSKMPPLSIFQTLVYPDAVGQEYSNLGKLFGILQMPHQNTYRPEGFCAPTTTGQNMSPIGDIHAMTMFAAASGTAPKRLLPFGTDGRTAKMPRSLHNSSDSSELNMNTVSGQEGNTVCAWTPRATRTPTMPHTVGGLNVITPANLRQELQSVLHKVHERHTEHAAQATEGMINRIKMLEDKIGQGFSRLDSALAKVDDYQSTLRKDITSTLIDCANRPGRDLTKFTAQINAEISDVRAGLQVQTDILNDTLRVRPKTPQPPPSPQPGHYNFLAQYPAPPGTNQKDYERTLLRAAWYYLNCLGNPDHSGWTDETAWTAVINAFPEVEADHLRGALDHAHMQAYGCLLPRPS